MFLFGLALTVLLDLSVAALVVAVGFGLFFSAVELLDEFLLYIKGFYPKVRRFAVIALLVVLFDILREIRAHSKTRTPFELA